MYFCKVLEQHEGFEIKLPQFEGPFDLLLFFIERDELDIHEIHISQITNDFLDYIRHMHLLNIELASEFIIVAATLMRIKAKMLLPRPDLDDEGNELNLKEDLIQKLIEYKKFKQITEELKVFEEQRFMQDRRGNIAADLLTIAPLSDPAEELAAFDLYKLMLVYDKLMSRYTARSEKVTHTIVQYPYSIEQQKTVLAQLLELNKKMDFSELKKNSENRVHFVYNFLAVLEMLQQQLISIQLGLGYNNFWIAAKANNQANLNQ